MNPPHKFLSFRDAITYHSKCPICLHDLEINDSRIVSNTKILHEEMTYHQLTFALGDDLLSINTYTEQIDITILKPFKPIYSIGNASTIPSSGIFIQGFNIDCVICCQFSYTIQMIVDMNEVRLAGVYLNSESISMEDAGVVHEVRNVYSTHKTEYTLFTKNGDHKNISLPLIPLNLHIPQETILRIRKLILYS